MYYLHRLFQTNYAEFCVPNERVSGFSESFAYLSGGWVDGGGGVNHVPIVGIVHFKNIQTIPFGDGIAHGFSLGTTFPVNRSVGNFRSNRQGPPARQNLST
jgi:hypothetical protein